MLLVCGCILVGAKNRNNGDSQRVVIDISGRWQSLLGECTLPGTTDENKLGDGKHPTDVTSQLTRLYPFSGIVSYERDIVLSDDMEGRDLILELERTKPSTLWVDGVKVGSKSHLYAPHVYELPVLKAGKHHLRIDIDNRAEAVPSGVHGSHAWSDATQTNWNGILGRMQIVALPDVRISDLQIYPNVSMNEVKVDFSITAKKAGKYEIILERSVYEDEDEENNKICVSQKIEAGKTAMSFTMDMGENPHLWSEFHPYIYNMCVAVSGKGGADKSTVSFGMREFSVEGTQFVINGNKTFLRGTHDACVFPLTAYCPTDVEEWRRLFIIAKQYGINHYRFHSYTPTEAAFVAADELGVYLHTELPHWGTIDKTTVAMNDLLYNEGMDVLKFLGNHPSFVSLGLGNELWGDNAMMAKWLDDFRNADNRHLYSQGSNNDLGWRGPKLKDNGEPAEDFYITCRVGGGEGFSTHARTSFSFADADNGGILNTNRPSTDADFSNAVSLCKVPVVSHETCQFQIYPDYKEIPKYTGVLYPYNLEIFRDRLKTNGLTSQIDAFHESTGKWAVDCYKADMEYCLRTRGFGGYQLLDIKDYPGQGSALCGILDAFMDSKGLVDASSFKGWNDAVVPLARMKAYCWDAADTLQVGLAISNYSENDYNTPLTWSLFSVDSHGKKTNLYEAHGDVDFLHVMQGDVAAVGSIMLPLGEIKKSTQLRLELKTGEYHNYYNMWVYASEQEKAEVRKPAYLLSDTLDNKTLSHLEKGGVVLLTPAAESIGKQSVGGMFTPDYWNYAMFKTISENNNKPVSPGTLGMLMNADDELFESFPTEGRTDWQWWTIALNSRPLILNSLDKEYKPIIQTVDNVERNHKLGILMEFKVGKGKLLISTTDFDAVSKYVEGKAYVEALKTYVASDAFNPKYEISADALRELLYSETKIRNIQGVKNLTDYKNN